MGVLVILKAFRGVDMSVHRVHTPGCVGVFSLVTVALADSVDPGVGSRDGVCSTLSRSPLSASVSSVMGKPCLTGLL